MTALIAYLIVSLIGLLYALGSRGTIVYINAPEDVISDSEKWRTLKFHILASIIIGIAFVNLLVRKYQPDFYDWITESNYLAISIILSIVTSFFLIAGIIQAYLVNTNPSFAGVRLIKKNPDLLEADEHYTSDKSLKKSEFWEAIDLVVFDSKNLQFDYSKILNEFSQRHPVWLMEFYHSLIEHKVKLLNSKVLVPYSYIFRKYEEDFLGEFCEFIIMLGREKYEQIINDLDEISTIDLNILSIRKYNLSVEVADAFAQKTRKLLVPADDFANLPLHFHKSIPKNYVKENLPKTYKKFK